VFEGLSYAMRLNYKVVEMHVDFVVVANVITFNAIGSPSGGSLVKKICRLIEIDWWCTTLTRKASQCPYALANHGYSLVL
jgi:hypothetical protein